MSKQVAFLGVDPGYTTGIAILDQHGKLYWMEQFKFEELINWMKTATDDYDFKWIIMENYVTYGHKAMQQTGSKQDAARVIGAIKTWAMLNDIRVHLQMATILSTAEKWVGKTLKEMGSHETTHWYSAYLHCFYFMVQRGLAKTNLQKEKESGNKQKS